MRNQTWTILQLINDEIMKKHLSIPYQGAQVIKTWFFL